MGKKDTPKRHTASASHHKRAPIRLSSAETITVTSLAPPPPTHPQAPATRSIYSREAERRKGGKKVKNWEGKNKSEGGRRGKGGWKGGKGGRGERINKKERKLKESGGMGMKGKQRGKEKDTRHTRKRRNDMA